MMEFENYKEPEYRINDGSGVIVGRVDIMLDLFRYLNHLANLPTTVLLRGETGTGKELCARALHYNSSDQRRCNNFVAVNCAGIPSELLESELFGYVKGAFTGAYKNTEGKFQHAHRGTILLDEISDMSPRLQAKVLRVLQEKHVTRVGSNITEQIEVRVIAATNRDLEAEVDKGNFREDLFYRLNVVPVNVPALNERRDDIPLIAEYFIRKYNALYNAKLDRLSTNAQEKLKCAKWNGNVRELENVIERVFVLRSSGMIEADDLYFNSDMPKGVLVHQTKQIESQEHAKGILWYQHGILPISPNSLSKFKGTKTYQSILEISDSGKICSVTFSDGKLRKSRLIYLTPKNIALFFKDKTTRDYRDLEARIQTDDFNQIAEQPFTFLRISEAIHNSGSSEDLIKKVEEAKAYKVPVGHNFCFAVTLENANCFVAKGFGEEERIAQLQNAIRDSYETFKNWSPN